MNRWLLFLPTLSVILARSSCRSMMPWTRLKKSLHVGQAHQEKRGGGQRRRERERDRDRKRDRDRERERARETERKREIER